jgi:intracellular septation protein
VWTQVLISWIAFFAVMGILNLYVAFNYSTDAWVNFKLFGGTGLMLVFVIGQALMLAKHIDEKKPD